jgi:hypothetical protein
MQYTSTGLCVGRLRHRQVPASTGAYVNFVVESTWLVGNLLLPVVIAVGRLS